MSVKDKLLTVEEAMYIFGLVMKAHGHEDYRVIGALNGFLNYYGDVSLDEAITLLKRMGIDLDRAFFNKATPEDELSEV